MTNAVLITIISVVGGGLIGSVGGPIVTRLLTRGSTNRQQKRDDFQVITDALNDRITELNNQVADSKQQIADSAARIDKQAAEIETLKERLDDREHTIADLRAQLSGVKGAVRRYLKSISDAWGSGGKMPDPDPADMHMLEMTIPRAPEVP